MKGLWTPVVIIGLLLLFLIYLLVGSVNRDSPLRGRILEQIQLFEIRDAEITRDAMLTRAGLLNNYDALMDDGRRLREALATLRSVGSSGTSRSGVALAPLIENLSRSLDAKLDDVERFKSDDALLRTSATYLTYTLSRMSTGSGTRLAMAADVRELSSSFLLFIQEQNTESGARFKAALDHLALRPDVDNDLRNLVSHGGLIADRLPEVVARLRHIVAAPTDEAAQQILARVEQISAEADASAQVYRYTLFLVSLVLLGYLVSQFVRLRASAHDLRRTNEELSREVQEREQAEMALRSSEERFRAIAESAHDAIISADSRGAIVSWNPAAEEIYGYRADEILGHPLARLFPPDAKGATPLAGTTVESTGVRKDGSEFALEASSGRWSTTQGSFVTAIVRDVSTRKVLEETARLQEQKLVQANKMAALGTLVSGVAHEINNPNQLMLLNSSVLVDAWHDACGALDAHREQDGEFTLAGLPYAEMRGAVSTLIRDLNDGARRIDRIVQDLKDFARPQFGGQQAQVNVNNIVQRAVRLLGPLVSRRSHHFRLALSQDLPPIRGDAQQVEQVVVNLVVNALEALPDPTHGVTVVSRVETADGAVVIEVSDEGVGISPENLHRLCDPFFTTKQDSGGTGLGLSVTFALVQAHGGRLDFDSEAGRGTRVTVSFPRVPLAA